MLSPKEFAEAEARVNAVQELLSSGTGQINEEHLSDLGYVAAVVAPRLLYALAQSVKKDRPNPSALVGLELKLIQKSDESPNQL